MEFNRQLKIAPSILAADFADIGNECRAIESQGCDWVHVDIMDGHFVPNISFGAGTCKAIRKHIKTVMDVHLMISPVDFFIDAFVESGADVITVHIEAGTSIHRTLQAIKANGLKAGIALNPATPAISVKDVLDLVDLVCVMTVNPGFGGQAFIMSQIEKIKVLRKMIGDRQIHLEVDGGITPENAQIAYEAGADILVAGSSVFKNGSVENQLIYRQNIMAIRNAALSSKKVRRTNG